MSERDELVKMVDAAMVEMKNISPPLRRSECERLIIAALSAQPQQEPVAHGFEPAANEYRINKKLADDKKSIDFLIDHLLALADKYSTVNQLYIKEKIRSAALSAPPSGVREGMLIDAVENFGHEVYISKQGGSWSASIGGKNSPTCTFMSTSANTRLRPVLDVLLEFIKERITRAAEQVNAEGPTVGCAGPSAPREHKTVSRTDPSAPQSEQTHVRVPVHKERFVPNKGCKSFQFCWEAEFCTDGSHCAATGKESE